MEFLLRRRSLREFCKSVIVPLSLYGLGSVESLMRLKIYQLYELKNTMADEEIVELYKTLKGLG